jgi:ribosomal protein S18 acetylase RimI-like enzyme
MKQDIIFLLNRLNRLFNGELVRVPIEEYVEKIQRSATLITVQEGKALCGFIAFYDNDYEHKAAFLTMLAVDPASQGKGIGQLLLTCSIDRLKYLGFRKYYLEVLRTNEKSIHLYQRNGFAIYQETDLHYKMMLEL